MEVVDLRFRMLAFRGVGGEPHLVVSLLSVSLAYLSRRSLAPCTTVNLQMKQKKTTKKEIKKQQIKILESQKRSKYNMVKG
jgi:hypothetical protein